MKELTKGDLVMTEHGLGFYVNDLPNFPRLRELGFIAGVNIAGQDQLEENGAVCKEIALASRAQVEVRIKEMGWFPTYRNYGFSHNKNIYFLMSFNNTAFIVKLEDSILSQDFDTAPAQLAEAILVAKLLNATKD